MTSHVSIRFYVGMRRNSDPALLDPDAVEARHGAVARFFGRMYPSGTYTRADGYWRGTGEPSAVFEVITTDDDGAERARAFTVAGRLAHYHSQEGVGVAFDPVLFRIAGPIAVGASNFRGREWDAGRYVSPATAELLANAGSTVEPEDFGLPQAEDS